MLDHAGVVRVILPRPAVLPECHRLAPRPDEGHGIGDRGRASSSTTTCCSSSSSTSSGSDASSDASSSGHGRSSRRWRQRHTASSGRPGRATGACSLHSWPGQRARCRGWQQQRRRLCIASGACWLGGLWALGRDPAVGRKGSGLAKAAKAAWCGRDRWAGIGGQDQVNCCWLAYAGLQHCREVVPYAFVRGQAAVTFGRALGWEMFAARGLSGHMWHLGEHTVSPWLSLSRVDMSEA
jgi:hypothetical protein